MQIQWYPGHMTKARRMMEENIKLIDLVIELIDARAPLSTRNPDIDTLAKNKFRLILLNKSDMSDKAANKEWIEYFKNLNITCIEINSRNGNGVKNLDKTIREVCKEKIERDLRRGIKNRPIRCMVVGIPNVGKSTFINALAGKACTKTGNKPGVTKGKQWISIKKDLELLDTPGILWPKFEDEEIGIKLAIIGSVNDEILDISELAVNLIRLLKVKYPGIINDKYGIDENNSDYEILENYASVRNLLKAGGEFDINRASKMLVDDFRNNRIGYLTLD
ncbi:MAG: ribosome biogenesis GTPase YlqF [Lachnospiraceae bacterium]|nr:ribosome biogenesis GTPase YlqF [Lachnospiraceae bacterium]